MTKKKLTAFVLALAMTVGLTQGAFAAELKSEETIEEQIQAEIQARTEEMYTLVYGQLEAQNAVGMIDDFMEIFIPEIEFEVMQKYGMGIVPYSTNGNRIFTFTYGGMVHYRTQSGNEIIAVYCDKEDTEAYIAKRDKVSVRDILLNVLSYVPEYGDYFDAISKLDAAVDAAVKQDIKDADGYARIISMHDSDGKEVSTAFGWDTYPTATYSDTVEILNREFFPA